MLLYVWKPHSKEAPAVDTVSTFMAIFANINLVLTRPTALNLCVLVRGALLATGERTVTSCLRAAWPWVRKHFSSYENVLRRSKLDGRDLSRFLFNLILRLLPDENPIILIVDETLVRRYGPYVAGLGVHRDSLRSSCKRSGLSLGHKWVVLSVALKLPFMRCCVALPILSRLYVSPSPARRSQVTCDIKHRSPARIAKALVAIVVRWAPSRKFVLVGDKVYGSHNLADTFNGKSSNPRMRAVSLVSRMQPDAGLYAPPPVRESGRGRRRVKGEKLLNPAQEAAREDARWEKTEVAWYGGTRKEVKLLTGEGLWYKCGSKATWTRWVLVRYDGGRRGDEVYFTTDKGLEPGGVVELYVLRWSLETTFEETRRHLGLETLRNRTLTAVQRSVPMLLALYSLTIVWFAIQSKEHTTRAGSAPWYKKEAITYSDILDAAREDILMELILIRDREKPTEFLFAPFPLRLVYQYLAKKPNAA